MGCGDKEKASLREEVPAGRLDPEAEDTEEQGASDDSNEAIQERCPHLGGSPEPVEAFDRAASRRGEGLGSDPRPRPTR
jgi:hypothetical protein